MKYLVSLAISFTLASILSTCLYIFYISEKNELEGDIKYLTTLDRNLNEAQITSIRRSTNITNNFFKLIYLSYDLEDRKNYSSIISSHLREWSFFRNNIDGPLGNIILADVDNQEVEFTQRDIFKNNFDTAISNSRYIAYLNQIDFNNREESTFGQAPQYGKAIEFSELYDGLLLIDGLHKDYRNATEQLRNHFIEINKWNYEELDRLNDLVFYFIILIFITQFSVFVLCNFFEFGEERVSKYYPKYKYRISMLSFAVFFSGSAFCVDQFLLHTEDKRTNTSLSLNLEKIKLIALEDIHRETRLIALELSNSEYLINLLNEKKPKYLTKDIDDVSFRVNTSIQFIGYHSFNTFMNWSYFVDENPLIMMENQDHNQILQDISNEFDNNQNYLELLYFEKINPIILVLRSYENTTSQKMQNEIGEKLNNLNVMENTLSIRIAVLIAFSTLLQALSLLSMFEFLRSRKTVK
jgi:hypothetical protein